MDRRNVLIITDMNDVGINEVRLRVLEKISKQTVNFENVKVKKFSVINGSFIIRLLADSCREKDIFIIILDPRYDSKPRESICLQTQNNFYFIGPNNGILSWVIKDFKIKKCVQLPLTKENMLFPTFNGKYKFAKTAGQLINGEKFSNLGKEFSKEDIYKEKIETGTVVHIDNYGNIKIKGKRPRFKLGDIVEIKVNGRVYSIRFGLQFFDVPEGELIIYPGSSLWGLPELAINRGNASEFLKVNIGDKIDIIKNN